MVQCDPMTRAGFRWLRNRLNTSAPVTTVPSPRETVVGTSPSSQRPGGPSDQAGCDPSACVIATECSYRASIDVTKLTFDEQADGLRGSTHDYLAVHESGVDRRSVGSGQVGKSPHLAGAAITP